jgi:hypothetical protein
VPCKTPEVIGGRTGGLQAIAGGQRGLDGHLTPTLPFGGGTVIGVYYDVDRDGMPGDLQAASAFRLGPKIDGAVGFGQIKFRDRDAEFLFGFAEGAQVFLVCPALVRCKVISFHKSFRCEWLDEAGGGAARREGSLIGGDAGLNGIVDGDRLAGVEVENGVLRGGPANPQGVP